MLRVLQRKRGGSLQGEHVGGSGGNELAKGSKYIILVHFQGVEALREASTHLATPYPRHAPTCSATASTPSDSSRLSAASSFACVALSRCSASSACSPSCDVAARVFSAAAFFAASSSSWYGNDTGWELLCAGRNLVYCLEHLHLRPHFLQRERQALL